jgi:hypothetical protein
MTEVMFATITRGAPEPVTWRARESPNDQAFFPKAMSLGTIVVGLRSGVYAVDQGLEIYRFLQLAVGRVIYINRASSDVRRIGVMANHTYGGLVITIATMQAQEVMAIITLGDVHHVTPRR